MMNPRDILKIAMHNGAVLGGILIAILFIFYITNSLISSGDLPYILGIAVIIIGQVRTTKKLRSNNNGELSFKEAYSHCFLLGLFASIFVGVFIMVLYTFDGNLITEYLKKMEKDIQQTAQFLSTMGKESVIDFLVDNYEDAKANLTPNAYAFSVFFLHVAVSTVGSLIISAVLKKKSNTFDTSITENKNLS